MYIFGVRSAAMLLLGVLATAVHAQNVTLGSLRAKLELVGTVTASGGGGPTFGVNNGDPRFMYVGEQNGRIRILDFSQPSPNAVLGTDFLNVDSALGAGILMDDTGTGERGLLGAAFHPDFNNSANPNGYRKFYTFTSEVSSNRNPTPHFAHQSENYSPNHVSTIREWTSNDANPSGLLTINTAIPSRVVMTLAKPGPFHNGGALQFGPDGYMYVSLGDGGGGSANGGNDGGNDFNAIQGHTNPGNPDTPGGWTGQGNAQDRRNPFGDILRIKPTTDADPDTNVGVPNNPIAGAGPIGWRVPKSNPFTAESQASSPFPGWQANWVDEIYAYGFRNPFRISFDSLTGKLYVADVGQDRNTISREEVSEIVKGGNYGWVIKSGTEINDRPPATPTNAFSSAIGVSLIDPVAQYVTSQLAGAGGGNDGGLAAIGGYVYRGDDFPALAGKYVFGDLNRGSGGGRLLWTDFGDAALNVFDFDIVGTVAKPNAFVHGVAADASGEIYYLFGNGQVMKLLPEFPIPEPGAIALALVGLIGAWQAGRLRSAA